MAKLWQRLGSGACWPGTDAHVHPQPVVQKRGGQRGGQVGCIGDTSLLVTVGKAARSAESGACRKSTQEVLKHNDF